MKKTGFIIILFLTIAISVFAQKDTSKKGTFKIAKPLSEKEIKVAPTSQAQAANNKYGTFQVNKSEGNIICTNVDFFIDERGFILQTKVLKNIGEENNKKAIQAVQKKSIRGMNDLLWNRYYTLEVCIEE